MNLKTSKNKNIIHCLNDPLFKNSLFIMLSSVSNAVFGFIFWVIAAKFYSTAEVGIATALISSMSLLILISRFGMDFSIIRFFPNNEKSKIFNTSVIVTTLFAVFLGFLFLIEKDVFAPELYALKSIPTYLIYLIYLGANSVIILTGISFIAVRKAEFQFFQNSIMGLKVLFLVPFISMGAIGIFNAIGISTVIALIVALILITRCDITPDLKIDSNFLVDSFKFSAGNYITSISTTAPNFILPIMVLKTLGAEASAYYYIAYSVAGLLFMIPNAISTSLFVEGSQGENLKKTVFKALSMMFSILIPVSIIVYVFAGPILSLFGGNYASEGIGLLRIMIFASIFVSLNYVYYSIQRVQGNMKGMVFVSGLVFTLNIILGYLFMIQFGVNGIGYSWLVSYLVGSIVFGMTIIRRNWTNINPKILYKLVNNYQKEP